MRTTLFAQSLSVAEQIEVFSQAKMIEIHSPHWAPGFYRSLAWMMGQQHGQVIGFTRGPSEDPMQDYFADPKDVESSVLEKLAEKKWQNQIDQSSRLLEAL